MQTVTQYEVVITPTPLFGNANQTKEMFDTKPEARKYIRESEAIKNRAKVSLVEVKRKVLERYDVEEIRTLHLKKQPLKITAPKEVTL